MATKTETTTTATPTNTRTLKSTPGLGGLYLKAALGATPLGTRGRAKDIPDRALEQTGIQIDTEKLAAYCHVTGFTLRDTLPTIYPNALAFPLHMALMTEGDFPFPVMGLVHIENKITQHAPIGVSEELSLRVYASELQPHAKGRQFDVITEARVAGELVSEAASTYLRRGKTPNGAKLPERAAKADPAELPQIAEWSLPGDLGRRYAAVAGDRNPIHMHNLAAKAFGFPRAIAHGMWTKARALAAFENHLADAHTVSVEFRRPILLPAKVVLAGREEDGSIDFGVRDKRKGTPHLAGRVDAA
jgi:hypothetical protein